MQHESNRDQKGQAHTPSRDSRSTTDMQHAGRSRGHARTIGLAPVHLPPERAFTRQFCGYLKEQGGAREPSGAKIYSMNPIDLKIRKTSPVHSIDGSMQPLISSFAKATTVYEKLQLRATELYKPCGRRAGVPTTCRRLAVPNWESQIQRWGP